MAVHDDGKLVSVYIPTHNRPDLVDRAIKSVLNQAYKNIELIVCDDGSDWDSYSGVRALLKRYNSIYLRNAKPMGACAARNAAIRVATGFFITGLDDDDEFAKNHVGSLVMSYDTEYAFVAASFLQITKNGASKKRYDIGEITLDSLLHYNRVGNQVLTETIRLRSVGLFDEAMPAMQDYDTWIRLVKAFGPGKKIADCTYVQRVDHDLARISSQSVKLAFAYDLLIAKNEKLFTSAHYATRKIMLSKIHGKKLSFMDFLTCTSKYNYRLSFGVYLSFVRTRLKNLIKIPQSG